MTPNPFDEFQPAKPTSEWDEFAPAGPSTKQVLKAVVNTNPDDAAEVARLAKRYPAPNEVLLRNLKDVRLQAAVDEADRKLGGSPKLAEMLRQSPFVAQQAHDDIEPLTAVESGVAAIGAASAGQAVLGMSEGIWRTPDAVQRGVGYVSQVIEDVTGLPKYLNPVRGVQDAIRLFSEGRLPVGPKLFAGTTDVADKISDAQDALAKDTDTFGTAFKDVGTLGKNADQALSLALKQGDTSQLATVLTSPEYWVSAIGQAAPSLAAALYSGGAPAFLMWLEGMEQASNAADFEKRTGVQISDAEFAQAVAQTAIVNAWLEKSGLDKIVGAQGKGVTGILKAMFAEGGTEALQQLNSNLSALLAYDEGKSLLEGVLMSAMGGAGSGGGVATAGNAAAIVQDQLAKQQARAAEAQRHSDQLTEALKAAAASKLRERNPETFQQLVAGMSDNTTVFIDAQVLMQSATPEQIAQMLPSTADQLDAAAAANGMVEVPISEALTALPGTPLEQVFVQNARATPTALSLADAQQAGEQAQEFLKTEAERVLTEAQDRDAWQAEVETVKQTVLADLNAAARFTPEVNESYAMLQAQFFSTMASRYGMTPAQLYDRYKVRVASNSTGGQVLNAGGKPGEITVEGYHYSNAARPVISTRFYGTGLRGSGRDLYLNADDKRLRNRAYFYVDKGTGINPESGVGGVAQRANLTNIYDSDADPLGLKKGANQLAFESAVLDAGFSGYLARMDGTQSGQVILLGDQVVQAEVLGPMGRIEAGQRVEALPRQAPQWKTQASGDPAQLQARLERMQSNPAWANYDMRIEGRELQVREKDGVFNQTPGALPLWALERAKGARISEAVKKAAIALSPTAKQARKNYDKLDAVFAKVPDPLASEDAWRKFMSLLVADRDVLGVPYNALKYARSPEAVAEYLARLRPDQLASRRAGFELGARIRQEYTDGRATPVTTGRLLLWAMLSRKAGAYPHEAAYMDLVNGGVDQWIEKAVNGAWTEADSEAYVKWSSEFMASKKGGVSPSAGVTSNANDFGRILLTKMSEKDGNGETALTRLHNLIADPKVSTDLVRREFFALGDSLGIQNKVLSFALLVTGRWDTLVLDRVQFTHLWGDQYRERAGQRNIYDNGLAAAGEGNFGLAVYEALARGMTESVRRGYELAGLTQEGDGTLGAFHWDSWLIESSQAIGHPTIEALDTDTPRPDLAVRQGKFDTYAYNFEYRADGQYQIPHLDGSGYQILSPAEAAEFQSKISDPKEGVVPKDFKVSQNKTSPWVDAEGVNRGRYDEILNQYGRRADAADVAPAGLADAGGPLQQRAADASPGEPAGYAGGGGVNGVRPEQTGDRGGRYSSRSLAPLEGAPAVAGAAGPDPKLVAVAEQYARDNGIELRRQAEYVQVDPERAARIAQAYAEMRHAPNDPKVKEAYADLIRQTRAQYDALVAAGYQFTFFDDASDPYQGNPWNAMRDLRANQHMAVYGTYAGFGVGADLNIGLADPAGGENLDPNAVLAAIKDIGGDIVGSVIHTSATEPTLVIKLKTKLGDEAAYRLSEVLGQEAIAQSFEDGTGQLYGPQAANWGEYNPEFFVTADGRRASETLNPLLADTGLQWPDQNGQLRPVKANDLFRAVHDAFGHGLEGAGFRAQGEENAWQAHVRLFTGPAVGAITSETRGQNSWLNYGPYGERNRNAKVEDTVFAEQKTGLMPEWTWSEGRAGDMQDQVLNQARGDVTQTPEFKRWFGDSKAVVAVNAETGRPVVSSKEPKRVVPQRMYHTTRNTFDTFEIGRTTVNSGTFGDWETQRHAIFVTPELEASQAYGTVGDKFAAGANVMPLYVKAENPLDLTEGVSAEAAAALEAAGMSPRFIYNGLGNWAMFDDEEGKNVVDMIKAAGYDSVIFNDENPDTGESFEAWALFEPTQIKSAIGNDGTFDADDPSILSQQARGTFNPQTLLITLNESANLSTFLHESGHFFLEVLADLASQPNAPQQIQDDMAQVLNWFGVEGGPQAWRAMTLDQKRPYHERFAESFEQYLMEGKAPSTELQPLFRKFRSWLLQVYKSLKAFAQGRDLQVSDDIRRVFDRMLATDEQIAEAEKVAGMLPDFDATNEAIERLQTRSLRDMKWLAGARTKAIKALQKQAATLRKAVEAEVREEVDAMPEFRAQRALADVRKQARRQPNDTEMAVIAEANGYASAEEMLAAIDAVGKKANVIEGLTDQRMLERHGDLVDQRAIEEAANAAVHNEARARMLATELKTQSEALNPRQQTGTASNGRAITVNALQAAAKQFAADLTARRKLKDLKNAAWQHTAAERRAAKRWQEATAKGQTAEAVQAKRDQLLNSYTAKAMTEALAEVKKIEEFFAKATKGNDEKIVKGGRDPDVVNAMRAMLAAYGIAPRLEKQALEYMEAVRTNDPAMYAALQPGVQAATLAAKPFGELTLEELRGLNEELRAMWLLAKRSRQMEVDGNLLDIEDAADQLMERMTEIGVPDTIPGERGAITDAQERGIKLRFFKAILSRVEQWAERMDGKFGGPFLRLVFQPIKEAADRYRTDRIDYRKRFTALLENLAPAMPRGPIDAPELGYTFGNARDSGVAELLHAILHTGNDSNKRKLLLGRGWATENADGTLDTSRWDAFINRMHAEGRIGKEHYDFAQGVWDLLEEMKPLAQEAHRKVYGRYFAEVTANEVVTPFGTYRGGYVPAQTDARIVKDAKLRELAEGENESMAYAFPSAPSGFTKARVEYNKPLLLDLRTLAQHMDKVLLFSHMQPAVNDVRRLLTAKRVSYALDRIDPSAYEGMLIPWLNRAAKQIVETPVVGDRRLSRFLSAARSRAGMALMFANLSNTVQQITGFSMAAVKVKPSLMLKAAAEFTRSPKAMKQTVADASPYMKDRMLNENAAMIEATERILVDPNLLERSQAWTQRHAYFMQAAVDNTMSPIIWTAAYNQAIEEGSDERDAVRFADGVVRQTQGSTLPEDVSRFETGPGYARLFTQFVSYFNMMANTNATAVSQIAEEMGLRKGAGKLVYVALAGLLVPIWVAEAIAHGFRGGPEDEDDDGHLDDWLMAVFGLGTLRGLVAQVPILGQAAQLMVNRFNDNPADDKFSLSPAVSLIESSVSAPRSVYDAIVEDGNKAKALRDTAAAATMLTGLPIYGALRPAFYATGVADDRVEPTGPVDFARGLVTGTASPESKQ